MSKHVNKKKRIVAIVTAAVLVLGGGGAAFAYWTSTGTGNGTTTTGTSVAFAVAQTTTAGGPLTPGGPQETVSFTVTNPGTGNQRLNAVAVTIENTDATAFSVTVGGNPACTAADYTIGTITVPTGDIAPGALVTGTVAITMNNLGTNQDSCKLAVVPLHYVAS
ncbi:hypothetical protein B7R54_00625 [Subtercola boreus]|uniref:DUF11 domain-containing protein n=1 Tax=Subtercola boreus TaxID=120213 RepID=A0A3E0VDB3_9MICO|nr:hypothetical protein [Subtercola boreus]RFA07882.1 hypothetical protein B7R54_00625 [Subtercola boreus]TQL55263.1 hypothetical protein FB464_2826 [Subtercola boreus]